MQSVKEILPGWLEWKIEQWGKFNDGVAASMEAFPVPQGTPKRKLITLKQDKLTPCD